VSAAGWRLTAIVARGGLAVISAAPIVQIQRQRAFEQAHPGSEFTPAPVGGQLLAWVPYGSGGVQFSGETLKELLDAAEEFFAEAAGPDTG
jgi:hypothetical protein